MSFPVPSLSASTAAIGSSPPPYTTGAVGFDGATNLLNNALSATDNGFISYSYWAYLLAAPGAGLSYNIFQTDPIVTTTNSSFIGGTAAGQLAKADYWWDVTGTELLETRAGVLVPLNAWFHVLASAQTNLAAGMKIESMYINGVDADLSVFLDTDPSFNMAYNGLPMSIGNDYQGDPFTGYMADLWIAPGQSLLTGGDISPSTIAKFINTSMGCPVDLGTNGQLPTGTAPAMFFREPHGSSDPTLFANNLGTGGTFSIVGDPLTIAPSSPTD